MASVCRDDACLRSFSQLGQRNQHEKLMHPKLVKEAATRLIQHIIMTNADLRKKAIKVDDGDYSYMEAQKIISEEPDGPLAKKIVRIFEDWVERYFMEEPEKDLRDLFRLEYKIN